MCVYWLKQVTAEWIVMSQMLVRATPGEANDREHSILYHYGHHEPISHEDNDLDFIYLFFFNLKKKGKKKRLYLPLTANLTGLSSYAIQYTILDAFALKQQDTVCFS